MRTQSLNVVPAKAGTHTPKPRGFGTVANGICTNQHLWLWVPAFAGTTPTAVRSQIQISNSQQQRIQTIIASVGEAIHRTVQRKDGLLRRVAPLRKRFAFVADKDGRIHVRDLAACLREFWPARSALQSEGAGNAGRPMRPIAACAMSVVERTRVSQVTPESPGIPRAMAYGFLRALPGDRLVDTVIPEKICFPGT